MKKLFIILAAVALATNAYCFVIYSGTACGNLTNTIEGANVMGNISFVASGKNMKIYSTGATWLSIPVVTNTTVWATTNVLGAAWKSYKIADTTEYTYNDCFMINEPVTLRLVSQTSTATNFVRVLVY